MNLHCVSFNFFFVVWQVTRTPKILGVTMKMIGAIHMVGILGKTIMKGEVGISTTTTLVVIVVIEVIT